MTIHKSRGSLYLEALSAQFGQKSPIVMSSHGTLPSIRTDAPGLITRTFLFLQHQGLPRKQNDKAMIIIFFFTTDAPGLITRTFLFLQHQDRHPGLPRMQTDKAMVINFSFSQTRKPDGEAIIPGTFHIDIPGWGQKLWVPTSILGAGLWTTTALGMMTQYISILAPSLANAKYYAQTFRTGLHCEGLKQASYTGYFKRLYYWW